MGNCLDGHSLYCLLLTTVTGIEISSDPKFGNFRDGIGMQDVC